MTKAVPPRDGFGQALIELAASNRRVVVLTADLRDSTRVTAFAQQYPDRFFDLGVAEQNMLGVAAGLADAGFIPFVTSYAVFNPGRNWDQLRVSVCYNQANVKIIGAHAGISVGPDGATHQGLEDIAITRVLPNLVVLAPADAPEVAAATKAAAQHLGPVYIRFNRSEESIVTKAADEFKIGVARLIQAGRDITICTTGSALQQAIFALPYLAAKGIKPELLHFPTVKPLDVAALLRSVRKTRAVVTVEEHQINGGFGGAVAEIISEQLPVPLKRVGVLDTFGESGQPDELRQKYHVAAEDIAAAVLALHLQIH